MTEYAPSSRIGACVWRAAVLFGPLAAVLYAGLVSVAAAAQSGPLLTVDLDRSLRFGQFALLGSGSRSLSAEGDVSDTGLLSVGRDGAQTARVTVAWSRGAASPSSGLPPGGPTIVQVVINAPARIDARSFSGRIVAFTVSGHGTVRPGEPFELALIDCAGLRCVQSFEVGATLEVQGEGNGSALTIPLSITARTISEP